MKDFLRVTVYFLVGLAVYEMIFGDVWGYITVMIVATLFLKLYYIERDSEW